MKSFVDLLCVFIKEMTIFVVSSDVKELKVRFKRCVSEPMFSVRWRKVKIFLHITDIGDSL